LVEAEIAGRTAGRFSVLLEGKRLRPRLLLCAAGLAGKNGGPAEREAVVAAACVELVHIASLIHDDVIDASSRRRSGAALHRIIGVKPAVILADLLFVQGLAMLAELRTPGLVHAMIREVETMCEGQWLEVRVAAGSSCSEQQYLEILDKKTASLFGFCCRAGALLGARTATGRHGRTRKEEIQALEEFGHSFGRMYQLLDDARDLPVEPGGAIGRAIEKWGGSHYLERKARACARDCRRQLAGLPADVARELDRMVSTYEKGEARNERREVAVGRYKKTSPDS
jgi:geranylgeranyl pyrophosphate synthase